MNKEIEIHFEVTHDCNLRCKHCIVNAGSSSEMNIDTKSILSFLEKLTIFADVSICFTGGEPLVQKDFKKILNCSLKHGYQTKIITNGLLLNDYYDILKKRSIMLGISVESFRKENFEAIRGKGTFDKLINVLDNLKERQIPFDIYTTINKYNENELEEIILKSKEYGAKVHFNDLTIDGRAKYSKGIISNKKDIIDEILKATKKIYNEDELYYDDNCWASNQVLFINNVGDIYLCTEQNRCNKRVCLGNIKTFPIKAYYEKMPLIDYTHLNYHCPYKVYYNDYITYTSNVSDKCEMICEGKTIHTLKELYEEFDLIFKDMLSACKTCTYKDCMGFIWLLKEEKQKCDNNNITTITINDDLDFLYFLKDYENKSLDTLEMEKIEYPRCEHRCENTGKCKIHKLRPLVCHMYPIGLETTEDGVDVWVLHDECEFVQTLIRENKIDVFIKNALSIINRIDTRLYQEIVLKYKEVDDISLFLKGINSYIILKEVGSNVKM